MYSKLLLGPIQLDFCELSLSQEVFVIRIFRETEMDYLKVVALWQISRELYKETQKFLPSCVLIEEGVTITKEAREFGTSENKTEYSCASAIVVSSLAHRILGNFIINLKRKTIPSKLFSDQGKAMLWLAQFDTTPNREVVVNELDDIVTPYDI